MKRIVFGLQYDGGPWQGWQTQLHGLTVQDQLQTALQKFSCEVQHCHCAGRTDAGVHALEQVVHFDTATVRTDTAWVRGVNAFLPDSIAVRWAAQLPATVPDGFHARFSARARTYHYVIYNHPIRAPLLSSRVGWVFRALDEKAMQAGADCLLGTHDFSTFRAAHCQAKSPLKTMRRITVARRGELIVLTFEANAFLHHMVRNIVGSLVYVGTGKQAPAWMATLLAGRDRSQAAPTFAAHGLYLAEIDYDAKWELPQSATPATPATLATSWF